MDTKTKIRTIQPRGIRRLIWDIEVSPNVVFAWKAGYDQNIGHDAIIRERKVICICWKWEGEKKVHYLTWDNNQNDYEMLKAFMAIITTADEAVAHYGDNFDMPWFKARLIHFGLGPLPKIKTIDTKAWAARNFYFNSNKLDYLGEFLGFGKKIKTDYSLWTDIVLKGSAAALRKMVVYCQRDVDLLEKVYQKLSVWCAPKTHVGVMAGLDKWTCPRTGSTNVVKSKTRVTASGTIQHQFRSNIDGGYYSISELSYQKYIEWKLNQKKNPKEKKGKGLSNANGERGNGKLLHN